MNQMLPRQFDANEWYILITLCVAVSILLILPRRFPTTVTIVFLSLGMGIPMFADFLIAPPPFDAYDINDTDKYELFDIIFYFLYPPFAYIFVYFYDKWKVRGLFISLYILVWSVIGISFEALAVYCHVFKYKSWTIGYSFLFYLAVQAFYLWLYSIIKKKYNQIKKETGPEWG